MTRVVACGLLVLAAMCWGLGNVANKTVLTHLGPFGAVALRCAIATVVVLPLALRDVATGTGLSLPWVRSATRLSALFAAGLCLQQVAYQTASVTNASFLVNTATVMVPVIAWTVHGYRPGLVMACAAPVTLYGAFLMTGAAFSMRDVTVGDLWCIGSAVFYALWTVALGQHAVTHGRPMATTLAQFVVATALILPLALLTEDFSPAAALRAWRELLMLGVISTALAFGLMCWAQRHVAASTAAVLVSAESLFGAAAAIVILGERPVATALVGAALILTAILLVALADASPAPLPSAAAASRVRPVPPRMPTRTVDQVRARVPTVGLTAKPVLALTRRPSFSETPAVAGRAGPEGFTPQTEPTGD